MSQNGKLMPNLDQHSTKVLNLTVLQRIDPFVEEILITAAHVTFYEFNIELNQWSRKDVEGSLFVVKRNTQPRFQFIVMNRRNTGKYKQRGSKEKPVLKLPNLLFSADLAIQQIKSSCPQQNHKWKLAIQSYAHIELVLEDNLVENLLDDFEYEVQMPYLLYRNAVQEVNGIWFYNSRECEDVANLFSRILNAYSKVPSKPKVPSIKSEFEELEAVPTMAVMEGPLEPSSSTASVITDVPDDSSFMNFFSAAMNLGNVSNEAIPRQPQQSPARISLSSHASSIIASPVPALQKPSLLPSSLAPPMPFYDTLETTTNSNHATNLVTPSSFFTPSPSPPLSMMMTQIPSHMPTAPPLQPPVNLQRSYGTPMLQPFPPPTPSPSLTPAAPVAPTQNFGPNITREKVRDALLKVLQKDQFIDMFYQELLNAHYS